MRFAMAMDILYAGMRAGGHRGSVEGGPRIHQKTGGFTLSVTEPYMQDLFTT